MPTITTKAIGPTGDYTTLASWEAAAAANLVAADEVWKGIIQVGATFSAGMTFAGSTTDSTRYKELTVDTGGAWCDSTSNPLRYATASGAYVSITSTYSTAVDMQENYCRVSRLQARCTAGSSKAFVVSGQGAQLRDCIGSTGGYNALYLSANGQLIVNCLFMQTGIRSGDNGACVWVFWNGTGGQLLNCTVAYPGGSHTNNGVKVNNYTTSASFKNTVSVGYTNGFDRGSATGTTFTTCYQDTTGTSYTGLTNGLSYSTSTFVDVGASTPDLKLVSGSALLDVGTTDSNASPDPYGTSRPSGSAYDVGAYELVVAAAFVRPKILTSRQAVARASRW